MFLIGVIPGIEGWVDQSIKFYLAHILWSNGSTDINYNLQHFLTVKSALSFDQAGQDHGSSSSSWVGSQGPSGSGRWGWSVRAPESRALELQGSSPMETLGPEVLQTGRPHEPKARSLKWRWAGR